MTKIKFIDKNQDYNQILYALDMMTDFNYRIFMTGRAIVLELS